ncbi:hypothetical protein YU66_004266 [Salmonella enterica subsp. enterica]|nr:hypothetical protein [Salmonella enterica subsp. enterica serovar Vuadens]ECJ4938461.1 hypothetical protein [Salmonella enterica subsp. enterica]EEJ6908380.1 hypothetical protein [Salmonella enterica subsp. enterica serovar Stanleyville]HAK3940411.1 hypothetical protein [Salmonella enterica]
MFEDNSPFSSIKDAFLQRINNSFFGFIALSFCVDNWRDIIYAFSTSTNVDTRINYIAQNTSIIFPIVFGCIAAALYPYVQCLFEIIHKKAIIFRWTLKSSELIAKKVAEDSVTYDKELRDAKQKAALKEIEYSAKIKNLEESIKEYEAKIVQSEDDSKMANIRFDQINNQLQEYIRMRNGVYSDIEVGLSFINEVKNVINKSLPYIDDLNNTNHAEKLSYYIETIHDNFKNIKTDKMVKFTNQILNNKHDLPAKF